MVKDLLRLVQKIGTPQVVIMNKEGAAMRFEKLGAQDKDLIMFTITGCFMSIEKV